MGWFQTILRAYGLPVKPAKLPVAALQQLVINNGTEPQSLDPHRSVGTPEKKIVNDLLEGLFIVDRDGAVVPGVALYAYSSNKQTWSFHLRKGAQWSNGDPITAHDFVYSWRRLADPQTASPRATILQDIKMANIEEILAGKLPPEALGVKALGPMTLHITLSQPLGFLKKLLVNTGLLPVHQATIEQYGDDWIQPKHWVGNGAYSPKERIVNEKIVLVRNPHYWNNSQTVIDRVTYLPIGVQKTEIDRYRVGDIDITEPQGSLLEKIQKLQQEFPQELRRFQTPVINGYRLNTTTPPFNDVRVRQALTLALDRETIARQLLVPGQLPAYNLVPNGLGGLTAFQPNWALWSSEQRLQTAKKLLQEAGYGPKNPLRFTLLYNTDEINKKFAVTVAALWNSLLDVEVILSDQEWKVFLEKTHTRNYQMARMGASTSYGDAYGLLSDYYYTPGCSNETGYNSPKFNQLLDQAVGSLYEGERNGLYHKAEAQLAEDVPFIPLLHPVSVRLVKPYIGGLSDHKQTQMFYTKDLHIKKHPLAPKKARP